MLYLIFWIVNWKADFRYSWHIYEQKFILNELESINVKTCKLPFWGIGPNSVSQK